jgi:hypothetical protein
MFFVRIVAFTEHKCTIVHPVDCCFVALLSVVDAYVFGLLDPDLRSGNLQKVISRNLEKHW